ncbi:MAG TPA: VTT domain-containing protein [Vicinamibacterales bacterium]|nr:VTT domain-containing protein [Vicinamibacterales bacterium]
MKRTIALIAIVAVFVIGSKLLIENVLGFSFEPWARSWMAHAGVSGGAVVIGLLAADIFIPVPSSIVMILSGAAFGVVWGSLLAFVGSIGGEWLGFELARTYGTSLSTRFIGDAAERQRLNDALMTHGAAAIVVTRALPVVMETMSIVAGLSPMRRSTFLIASTIGTAPIVVVYAYAGAKSRETGSLVPAIVILMAVAATGWIWYRAIRKGPSSAASHD